MYFVFATSTFTLPLNFFISMLYSMTGYGRAEQTINDKTFLIEIRSLNGKQFDIRLNIPSLLKPYEFDIRNIVNEGLIRGSIECNMVIKQNGSSEPVSINIDLIKAYYEPVLQLAKELNLSTDNVLSTLLKLPDTVITNTEIISEEEWQDLKTVLQQAIAELNKHRQ